MTDTDTTDVGFSLAEHVRLAAGIASRALTRIEQWEPDSPEAAVAVHGAAKELALLARALMGEAGRHL